MARPLPQEIVNEGRKMYRAGAKARYISRELGIGLGVINQYITDADLLARADAIAAGKPKTVDEDTDDGLPVAKHERTVDSELCLPEPFAESYEPYVIDKPGVWGILSDTHIPYFDKLTVELFVGECRRRGAVGVLLNGDLLDHHEVSDHDKDPRAPRYIEEIEIGKKCLTWLRGKLPKTDIVYRQGNHEFRLDRYIIRKAPALFGLEGVDLPALLHLKDYGIEWLADKRVIHLGKLSVIHGHEYPGGVSSPVNPARGLYMKARSVALAGHHHRTSEHHDRDIRGFNEAAWSVGCSCFLSPAYRPLNSWNLGFAFVDVEADGNFVVENKRVLNGKIV